MAIFSTPSKAAHPGKVERMSGAARMERSAVVMAALGLATALAGCNPAGYPDCFRVQCPSPPFYHASYAGYVPAYEATYPPRPAFFEPPWDDPFVEYTQRTLTIS